MYKKNSWIVALLMALSFSIFFIVGCINPLAETPPDADTYTEVELTGFNAVGGNDLYQKGWGTDGSKDAKGTVKSIGLTVDDLQKAKYLVVEVNDGFPKNNFETIYDSYDADGNKIGDWQQFSQITNSGGTLNPGFGTREGNVLKLEMSKIIKNYSVFKDGKTAAITLLIQHWGNGGPEACIKSAKLLIPDTPPPFVSISNMSLVSSSMYWTSPGFQLEGKITPADATNQTIIWSIVGWGPPGSANPTITLPKLDPFDDASVTAYNAAKDALFAKINYQQEEYVVDTGIFPNEKALRPIAGTLIVPKASGINSVGRVTVKAIVKQGIKEKESYSDFEINRVINIVDPPLFTFKFVAANGDVTTQSTKTWGAVDNGGVKGGWMDVIKANAADTDGTAYTVTLGGGYANSHHYFEVNLGSGTLKDYRGVRCHYKAGEGDSNLVGKTVRVRGSTTIPPRTYSSAGAYVATLAFPGGADVLETDLDFEFFKDKGNVFDTDKTGNKDMPSPNQTINNESVPFQPVKDANIVYLWFVPWSDGSKDGKATTFTISNVEFYK